MVPLAQIFSEIFRENVDKGNVALSIMRPNKRKYITNIIILKELI